MSRKLITFDRAIKRLLRSKANFGILAGFLSELLKDSETTPQPVQSGRNPFFPDCLALWISREYKFPQE
jgi:hypothetical protein